MIQIKKRKRFKNSRKYVCCIYIMEILLFDCSPFFILWLIIRMKIIFFCLIYLIYIFYFLISSYLTLLSSWKFLKRLKFSSSLDTTTLFIYKMNQQADNNNDTSRILINHFFFHLSIWTLRSYVWLLLQVFEKMFQQNELQKIKKKHLIYTYHLVISCE